MKRFLYVLCPIIAATFVSLMLQGQEAKKMPTKAVHGRGRVAPKNLHELKVRSHARYGYHLKRLPKVTAPSWDCRTLGLVPPIVDQGQCGSCWDFSGTGMVTSALMKAGYGTIPMSEQYTLDCGQNGGCNGDDNTTVLDWAKKTGLPSTADYGPYQAQSGSCRYKTGMTLYKISDWGFCTTSNSQAVATVQDIKNAMVAYGPIGCAVAAGGSAFWDSGTGTDTGNSDQIDHDVILVGWDDNHDNGDSSKGAWIMRNSWGESWGVQGYAWVKYGADSIGTEAVWCTAIPIIPPPPPPPPPGVPSITSPVAVMLTVGMPWSSQIVATNNPTSYGSTSLPLWLTLSATTGSLSGTPTLIGNFQVPLSATNATGTGNSILALTVTDVPPPPPPPNPNLIGSGVLSDGTKYDMVPSGSVVITGEMSLREFADAIERCKNRKIPVKPR